MTNPDGLGDGIIPLTTAEEVARYPMCGHSACRRYWIDTGEGGCTADESPDETILDAYDDYHEYHLRLDRED